MVRCCAFGPIHHKAAPVELDFREGSVTHHELRHGALVRRFSITSSMDPELQDVWIPSRVGKLSNLRKMWNDSKTRSSGL